MRPLILEYALASEREITGIDKLEYCDHQNLNVIKETGMPAVLLETLDTETFTKANMDVNESDNCAPVHIRALLDTELETRQMKDVSESDSGGFSAVTVLN